MKKLLVTIPHSGEKVPEFCHWLKNLPEPVLMCDVDRFVDQLYAPALENLNIPFVKTEWHRYAADLNRIPEDIDQTSVVGSANPPGVHNRGFHWVVTTHNDTLMPAPMPVEMHQQLVDLIYKPFHANIRDAYKKLQDQGLKETFHIDAHSMPSVGTKMHRDPGERRADIVVSDCKGKSSKPEFVQLVIESYQAAGFKVAHNWPYLGGRVTEQYGDPQNGRHVVQVELNRDLYMNEQTKRLKHDEAEKVQQQIEKALHMIQSKL